MLAIQQERFGGRAFVFGLVFERCAAKPAWLKFNASAALQGKKCADRKPLGDTRQQATNSVLVPDEVALEIGQLELPDVHFLEEVFEVRLGRIEAHAGSFGWLAMSIHLRITASNSVWIVHLSVNSAKSQRPIVPRLLTPGTQ